MSDIGEAFQAVLGLAFGGVIFLMFGSALNSTSLIDFGFWGVIYLLGAIVLAIILVVGVLGSLLEGF